MKYIEGENANIYDIFSDMITFLQSVGWTLVKNGDGVEFRNRAVNPVKQAFMRLPTNEVVAFVVCKRRGDGHYVYNNDFYAISAKIIANGDVSNYPFQASGGDFHIKGSYCFIESHTDKMVRSYRIFADDRTLLTSFEILNGMPHIGAYLSKIVKTSSSYSDDMIMRGTVFYRDDDWNVSQSSHFAYGRTLWSGSDKFKEKTAPYLYADCACIKAGETLKPAITPNGVMYPGLNAVRNTDGYAPLVGINVAYKHADGTTRYVGYVKDIFIVAKNGLKIGEIIVQAEVRYMVVEICATTFYLAVKIDG